MKNKNPYSKENLLELLNSNDDSLVSSAERLLGVCKYPENYWVMPDYYYPGIRFRLTNVFPTFSDKSEKSKAFLNSTSNDKILMLQDFSIINNGEYSNNKPVEGLDIVSEIKLRKDEIVELKSGNRETVEVPWSVLCGIFLKCRELGYSRPDVLDYAGPVDDSLKEKWLKNQEKIKELQEKID